MRAETKSSVDEMRHPVRGKAKLHKISLSVAEERNCQFLVQLLLDHVSHRQC